jgi:hypothetical protein
LISSPEGEDVVGFLRVEVAEIGGLRIGRELGCELRITKAREAI